jgi:hypothetical protein
MGLCSPAASLHSPAELLCRRTGLPRSAVIEAQWESGGFARPGWARALPRAPRPAPRAPRPAPRAPRPAPRAPRLGVVGRLALGGAMRERLPCSRGQGRPRRAGCVRRRDPSTPQILLRDEAHREVILVMCGSKV